jgi:shikimate kinase
MTPNIFMLGMPSSGKSTLGRQLAKELNFEFIDLDKKIEIAEGKKISEIFNLEGQEYFRKVEAEQLRKIDKDSKVVVATGGGTPCFHNNMQYINENGLSVFLDVSPEKLEERMKASKRNNRPMFDLESEDLLKNLQKTYTEREQFYKSANVVIEGDTDANTILWIIEAEFAKNK